MPQALDASSYVYQGIWTNWSKGEVLGRTLTLAPSCATVLIAVLAIFVQVTGSQLWIVFQLALHQFRATQEPRDGFYHQQQAVLRNNTSDLSSVWQLLRLAHAWRHQKTVHPIKRSFGLLAWALIHFAFFALAGIFSPSLVSAGDAVLSRSPFCGTFSDTYFEALESRTRSGMPNHLDIQFYAHYQTRCQQSQVYAESCYTDSGLLADCNLLARPQLSWNKTTHGSCPFNSSVCLPAVPTVTYDTGYISSHSDLGINAPEQDRIWYRKQSSCTVLNDAKYISDWKNISATADSPAKTVVDAYYGFNPDADRGATYSYSEWVQYYSYDQYSDISPYQINARYAAAGDTHMLTSNFAPIPELVRGDADVALIFLSFNKMYEAAVNDPWFSTHEAGPYPVRKNQVINGTVFNRDRPVTTVACTEQHQICTGGEASSSSFSNHCTPMLGWLQLADGPNGMQALHLTPRQLSTYQRVFQAVIDSSFPMILQELAQRDPPLLARRLIQGPVGLGLPDDQWQRETEYWHAIAMAHIQRSVVAYGTGEFAADTSYINVSTAPSEQWLCQNLVIHGTSYESFSVFALSFIFVIGILIVVAGATIEDLVGWSQRKLGRGISRQEDWVANGLLAMQSMLYERDECGVWSRRRGIPICGPGEKMCVPKRRQQHHHHHHHKKSSETSGSSFEMPKMEARLATGYRRGGTSTLRGPEYEILEDADVADRMNYPPAGWGVLPPPGTAL